MSGESREAAGARLRDALRVLRIELGILNDKVAVAAGLNPRDLDVLDVIDRDGPCTPSHLAERTGQRRATLTGVLARLEKDGWVTREPDPSDRRSALLASTTRFDELRVLYAEADEGAADLTARLTRDELATLVATLPEMARIAREAGESLAGRAAD